ncbi:MAG: Fur family transcriptional regulator [Candidatus Dormiibacterota bacterium]
MSALDKDAGRTTTSQVTFVASLRARGLRATPQRVVLHRIVSERNGHVTADELLAAATAELPSVSLPTIYAALGLLEQMDVVRRVSSLGGTTIYDTRRRPHHHAVCRICGKVEDLEAMIDADPALAAAGAAGFGSLSAQVTVQGVCAECAAHQLPERLAD